MEGKNKINFEGKSGLKSDIGCCFNSNDLANFFDLLAQEIVQKFTPKVVLNVGSFRAMGLVESLRRLKVEAYGLVVDGFNLKPINDDLKDFCFSGSILAELPSSLPKVFDLVVFDDILNLVEPENLKQAVVKLSELTNGEVLISRYSCNNEMNLSASFSKLAGFFADVSFFRSCFEFFQNKMAKVTLFSKSSSCCSVVQNYEQSLAELKNKINSLTKLNEKLQFKVLKYAKSFVSLKQAGQKYVDIKREHNELLVELNVLRASYDKFCAITNSSFWKLTKPFRLIVDFFRINVKSFCKQALQKIFHLKFKVEKDYYSKTAYGAYFKKHRPTDAELAQQRRKKFKKNHVISIVVPVYNTPIEFLKGLLDSVNSQTYEFWQLCIADGSDAFHFKGRALCEDFARQNPKIKYLKLEENLGIAQNTNAALKMATGDFIALLDHDDLLSPNALFECASVIEKEGADFVYSDEMTFENRLENVKFIHFKPDFSPDTLRSNNYICHLSVFATRLVREVGGFSGNFDGSQDYDIFLRLTEKAKKVVHIPKVLYYWREHSLSVAQDLINKPYCLESAKKALAAHLKRVGLKGKVFDSRYPSTYRIEYEVKGTPKVSIIILNRNSVVHLKRCVDSILNGSSYSNFEIVIIENSSNSQTFDYYDVLKSQSEKVKVVVFDGLECEDFNYGMLVNFGVKQATGDYFILLHNDVVISTKNWIEQMLMFAQRSDVGAVGVKLLYSDDLVQGGGFFLSKNSIALKAYRFLAKNEGGYVCRASYVQNLSAVSSACLMTKRDVWLKVDGFDEALANVYGDVDFCLKLRKQNYLVVYNAVVEAYHYEATDRKRASSAPEDIIECENEKAYMKSKWGDVLEKGDPYYNINFDDNVCDFTVKRW